MNITISSVTECDQPSRLKTITPTRGKVGICQAQGFNTFNPCCLCDTLQTHHLPRAVVQHSADLCSKRDGIQLGFGGTLLVVCVQHTGE